MNSGFLPSELLGAPLYTPIESPTFPEAYDMREELSAPINQGDRGICVSVCTTDMVGYAWRVAGKKYKKKVDYYYNKRECKVLEGMSPREAFEIAEHNELIKSYAIIRSLNAARVAIVANGPVLIALPVCNYDSNFWEGEQILGYHAVTLVGFDERSQSFTLRNSWGVDWGEQGYTQFPYYDYSRVLEAWTIYR